MCIESRTMFLVICLAVTLNLAKIAHGARLPDNSLDSSKKYDSEVEKSLELFLNIYYDEYIDRHVEEELRHIKSGPKSDPELEPEDDIYETMQGDQPTFENNINQNLGPFMVNSSNGLLNSRYNANFTEQYREALKNRSRENFIQFLKKNILEHLGRTNMSNSKHDDARFSSINMSQILPTFLNSTNLLTDDQITEKIRSFYPSCERPVNTDQDIWEDDDVMNLFYDFDPTTNDRNSNIATATLRLYRLPENGTLFHSKDDDCDSSSSSTEDDKLLRVSIYWYTKTLKRRRVKRRLSDSKVISERSRWVELSVKPAAKAWTKGRNLGLGVHVEDQEGNTLRAKEYFKGATCMPRPNLSQLSSLTPPGNYTDWIAYLDEIQRQPRIVTHTCSQP